MKHNQNWSFGLLVAVIFTFQMSASGIGVGFYQDVHVKGTIDLRAFDGVLGTDQDVFTDWPSNGTVAASSGGSSASASWSFTKGADQAAFTWDGSVSTPTAMFSFASVQAGFWFEVTEPLYYQVIGDSLWSGGSNPGGSLFRYSISGGTSGFLAREGDAGVNGTPVGFDDVSTSPLTTQMGSRLGFMNPGIYFVDTLYQLGQGREWSNPPEAGEGHAKFTLIFSKGVAVPESGRTLPLLMVVMVALATSRQFVSRPDSLLGKG